MEHLFFYIALAFLLTHEMDAIRCHEWRIFPGLSRLNDDTGLVVFTLLHVPLFALLLWGLLGQENNEGLIRGLNVFSIVHVVLHLIFLKHPKNEFTSAFSWMLIAGAGLSGLLSLLA